MTNRRAVLAPFLALSVAVVSGACSSSCGGAADAGSTRPQSEGEVPLGPVFLELSREQARKELWPQAGGKLSDKKRRPEHFLPSAEEELAFKETLAEILRYAHIFAERDEKAEPLADVWKERWQSWRETMKGLGFRLEAWKVGQHELVALIDQKRESSGEKIPVEGKGSYLIRMRFPEPSPSKNRLLQLPHSFFDKGTGRIGYYLFFSEVGKRFQSLAVNTLHRYGGPNSGGSKHGTETKEVRGQDQKPNPASGQKNEVGDDKKGDLKRLKLDLAHLKGHWFQHFTGTQLETYDRLELHQLHGFGEEESSQAVLSSGRKQQSSSRLASLANGMSRYFDVKVERFPEESSRLGAVQNTQGQMLRRHPFAEFIHVEMGPSLRHRLLASEADLQVFGELLTGSPLDSSEGEIGEEAKAQ